MCVCVSLAVCVCVCVNLIGQMCALTTSTTTRDDLVVSALPGRRNRVKFGKVKAETIFPLCEKWYRFHWLQSLTHTHRQHVCVCVEKLVGLNCLRSGDKCVGFPPPPCVPLCISARNPFPSGSHASALAWVIYRKSVFGKTSFSLAFAPQLQFNVSLH